MGYRRVPFAQGEWYHCFSRGIDKRVVFKVTNDFWRFEELLYLANSTVVIDRGRVQHRPHEEIFTVPRGEPLVAVGAYCLMNNHPHLLLQEKMEGGISRFMHKIGTGYTSYFNIKYSRIGNLLVKPFRSRHIADDRYLRRVAHYIHLNPVELFEPGWKEGRIRDAKNLEERLLNWEHSSLPDYADVLGARFQSAILDPEAVDLIKSDMPSLREVLRETAAYYAGLTSEFGTRSKP